MGKSYQHLKITSTSSPVSLPLLRIMDKVTSFHTPCPRGHEVKMLVAQSCLTLYDPVDCSPLGSSVLGVLQARKLEGISHFLPQGILPTQGSKPGLLNCRQILHRLSHQGILPNSYLEFSL